MSDPIRPAPRPASPADVKPTMLQATLTFVGGLVLAAGSCAGFLATLNMNRESAVNVAFALGFFASLIAAFVGVVMIIFRVVVVSRRRRALALQPDPGPGAAGTATATTTPAPAATAAGTAPLVDGGPAWKALVLAAVLLVAAVGFVVMLVAVDPNPMAALFLVLAAASGVGSLVSLVIAFVRYGRGR